MVDRCQPISLNSIKMLDKNTFDIQSKLDARVIKKGHYARTAQENINGNEKERMRRYLHSVARERTATNKM